MIQVKPRRSVFCVPTREGHDGENDEKKVDGEIECLGHGEGVTVPDAGSRELCDGCLETDPGLAEIPKHRPMLYAEPS